MTALILGGGGQDGHYLHECLVERGIASICMPRSGVDVSDFNAVEAIISSVRPSYVFNLAAASTTRHDALFENHATISTGNLNVLEAVRLRCPNAKVFITGSAVQFENNGTPIDENNAFKASSPYAIARIQSVYAARYYRSLGLQTYVGYLFHHESPLRKPNHVSKMIVDAANRIAEGSDEKLVVGDIYVVKEWTFAEDVVEAILTLVGQNDIFEAVIGSGEGHSIREWIELCFGMVGLDWKDHIIERQDFSAEYKTLISNPLLIKSLGWGPKTSFKDLATMMSAI
jgi:GDPmannose 4,6-dehydratase